MTVNGHAQDEDPQEHPQAISGYSIGEIEAASGWKETSPQSQDRQAQTAIA